MEGSTDGTTVFCAACGAEVEASANFCGACGADQEPFQSVGRSTATDAEIEPERPAEPPAPPAQRSGDTDPIAELTAAIAAVKGLDELRPAPSGQLTEGPVGRLLAAAETAYSARLDQEATTALLDEAITPGSASPMETAALAFATARDEDCEFRTQRVGGLRVRRVDFKGSRVEVEDLGIELVVIGDGAPLPRPANRQESPILTIAAADLQLFGPNDGADGELERVHARGFDNTGIWEPSLAISYEMRLLRRMLWGAGLCTLTERRALGIVFQADENPDWSKLSPERAAMPTSLLLRDVDEVPTGTLLVFSVDRVLADRDEEEPKPEPPRSTLRAPLMIGRNMPDVSIDWGEVQLLLDARGVIGEGGEVRKPGKREVAAAIEAFAPPQQEG